MKIITEKKKIEELLTRAVDEVIVKKHLEKEFLSGKQLRVKFGIDPTAPDLHLGHTLPLRKLQAFQELGHQAVLIIGDFTATIGDPSGRSEMRRQLTAQEVKENMKYYLAQAEKILDLDKVEIRHNSEWFGESGLEKIYELTSKVSIQRALERDDFQKRLAEDREISVLEVLYPLLQGYDSVMVRANVEIGGRDQKFNLLMGRRVQRGYGQPEQDILTTWLIEGTDGVRKMSKSFNNYIALTESPDSMYGKIMSIPDELIVKYFRALTDVPNEEVGEMLRLSRTSGSGWKPLEAKKKLAREIVAMYHNQKAAQQAEVNFARLFQKHEAPGVIAEVKLKKKKGKLIDILVDSKLAESKSEARRLVEQGGIKVGEQVIKDVNYELVTPKGGAIIQRGKRRFVKVTV